jgi:hypothetical protein
MNAKEIVNKCQDFDCVNCAINFAKCEGAKVVLSNLDTRKGSFYEVSTTVLKDSTGVPFGIRGVTMFRDDDDDTSYSDWEELLNDWDCRLNSFLMEEVSTGNYKKKNKK